jgi:two-component system cell cycle sensor histidine kinase/response regulator CckA
VNRDRDVMANSHHMSGRAPAKTRRKSTGILQIARQVSATIGAEFFRALVEHLSEALAAECVYVGEFVGGQVERVKTLSASVDGQTDVAFDYPLAGSASATAALGAASACRSGARDKFREDAILSRIAAEAFVGVPLLNAHQQAVGVIMAVYRRPVSSLQVPRSVLEIFAPRAAAELIRKQADEQLRESEERHRAFICSSPDGMWRVEFDPPVPTDLPEKEQVERIHRDGYIAECNDAMARFLGRNKAAELMGCRLSDFDQIRSESSITLATLAAVRVGYRPITVETQIRDPYGKLRYLLRSQWGVVERGLLQRMWGTSRDVTELRRSELELDASERRMADLLEALKMVVVTLDLSGTILSCNDHLLQLTGWQSNAIKGRNWFDLMIPEPERETLRARFEAAKAKSSSPVHVEASLLGPDNRHWWIAWDWRFLGDTEGTVTTAVFVGRDITGYRELEAEFRQAQKLESIGRLASGVAHDFNNLLTVIIGYAGALLADRNTAGAAYVPLAEIKKTAEKGADLAYQLLTFSSRQTFRPTAVNLNTLIEEDQRMLRRLIGDNIELNSELDPVLGTMRADPGHLRQVLLNLAVNARDAMPRGGKLLISASNVEINGTRIPELPGLGPGQYIRLTVADTGTGMSEEVRSHLFEPFFTTKAQGKGSGLGLSTVYGIVQQSGGHIFVDTKPNHGSTFSIFFPRIDVPASPPTTGVKPSVKGGTETILLVENEYELRVLSAKILRASGYTVWEADSPEHAIELARYSGARVDLILTDVALPGLGGIELADRLKSAHPEIKILFMSGREHIAVPLDPAAHGFACLEKPFNPDSLVSKVREVLDQQLDQQ